MSASSQPAPSREALESERAAIATIVMLVGKGMSVREIRAAYPELTADMIRQALLRAADILSDENASLATANSVNELISMAQRNSDLSEEEAIELAVAETRAYRREKTAERSK